MKFLQFTFLHLLISFSFCACCLTPPRWRRIEEWRAFQNPCSDRGTTKHLEETRTEDTPRRIHYVTHPTYPAPSGILVVFCQSQIRKIAYVVWVSFRTPYSLSLLDLVSGFGFLVSGSLSYNSKRGTGNSKLLNQPSGEADAGP